MRMDWATVKPSVASAITILLIVAITVPLAKWGLNRFPVPGLTPLINAI